MLIQTDLTRDAIILIYFVVSELLLFFPHIKFRQLKLYNSNNLITF